MDLISIFGIIGGVSFAACGLPMAYQSIKTGRNITPVSTILLVLLGGISMYLYLLGLYGFNWLLFVNYSVEIVSWMIPLWFHYFPRNLADRVQAIPQLQTLDLINSELASRMAAYQASLNRPDLPLIEGESKDVRQDAINLCGENWLETPNIHFSGKSPEEIIQEGRGASVRDALRQILHVGMS